jgi:hypothetical protein
MRSAVMQVISVWGASRTAPRAPASLRLASAAVLDDPGGEAFRPASIRFVPAEDDAVVVVQDGRGVANDEAYEKSHAWIMRMRGGKVVDGTAFYDSISIQSTSCGRGSPSSRDAMPLAGPLLRRQDQPPANVDIRRAPGAIALRQRERRGGVPPDYRNARLGAARVRGA